MTRLADAIIITGSNSFKNCSLLDSEDFWPPDLVKQVPYIKCLLYFSQRNLLIIQVVPCGASFYVSTLLPMSKKAVYGCHEILWGKASLKAVECSS